MANTMANPSLIVTPSKNCLCVPLIPSSHVSLHGPTEPVLRAGVDAAIADAIGTAVMDAASAAAPRVTLSRNARRSLREVGDAESAIAPGPLPSGMPPNEWLMTVS